jgi:hypothetical protein
LDDQCREREIYIYIYCIRYAIHIHNWSGGERQECNKSEEGDRPESKKVNEVEASNAERVRRRKAGKYESE